MLSVMQNDPIKLKAFLKEKQSQHLYRTPLICESAQQPAMKINGKDMLTFCSNDYLGLANHPDVIKAFKHAADKYGVGSGAAHLINGHSIEHQMLEEELAAFTGRDRVLLFSTGYMANMGVVNALMERGDAIFADRLNHASLIDASLLSKAKLQRYAHNDLDALQKRYANTSCDNSLILSDGVFSMDGDCAPVTDLATIAEENKAWLMIDDAHGFGVLGKNGAGLLEQQNLSQQQVPILMATLGKAFGTAGAFIAGSDDLIEYLIQTARTYIYTTAMPPAIAAATRASLKLVQQEHWRREKLDSLIGQFKQGANELGLELMPSDTPIQPILIGDSKKSLGISKQLKGEGMLVTAIRPPTVEKGTARLRVTFSASHNDSHIKLLLDKLSKAI